MERLTRTRRRLTPRVSTMASPPSAFGPSPRSALPTEAHGRAEDVGSRRHKRPERPAQPYGLLDPVARHWLERPVTAANLVVSVAGDLRAGHGRRHREDERSGPLRGNRGDRYESDRSNR